MAGKYRLETIPVWRAFEADTECALCDLENESEQRNVTFFLGSSVMAPEMRVELNEHGFCARHFHMLGEGTGKLGLSLALGTHIDSLRKRIRKAGRGISGNKKRASQAAVQLSSLLDNQATDCLMCDRIQHNMKNYAFTTARLFVTDSAFRDLLESSRGVCLRHLSALVEMGAEVLSGDQIAGWSATLLSLTDNAFDRLGQELEQFSWQFDAASTRSTPEAAADAVPRAIRKLAGYGPR